MLCDMSFQHYTSTDALTSHEHFINLKFISTFEDTHKYFFHTCELQNLMATLESSSGSFLSSILLNYTEINQYV